MVLDVCYRFLPKRVTLRGAEVMDHFGIDYEVGENVIAEGVELPLERGDVVCFVGDSGSGKSSLLRTAGELLDDVLVMSEVEFPEATLIDGLGMSVQEGMELLSACGLGEARLMLRYPSELSEGERYRYRLALCLARQPEWIVADEFTSSLDRVLAKVIARNVRLMAGKKGIGFLVATTHEDVLSGLAADVVVRCRVGRDCEVICQREESGDSQKKSGSVLRKNCGSVRGVDPTGRISLGGIIDRTQRVM